MTETLSREEALQNDLENLYFSRKYYIGVLAELEQLGRTHTEEFKKIEESLHILSANIKRIEKEIDTYA